MSHKLIDRLLEKALSGSAISRAEAVALAAIAGDELDHLLTATERLRQARSGSSIELCAIVNAKSGLCPENCAYCAQSAASRTGVAVYPLISRTEALEKAREAKEGGVHRFSIVTSGKRPDMRELREIAMMIEDIRSLGLGPCASLGLLGPDELALLREHGLERYHCNLETSERFFPKVCTAHAFSDKLKTIEAAHALGMSVCSGGIFGMGETWEDRIDMALTLRELGVASAPLNFLVPIPGTPLGTHPLLPAAEALKAVALYRFILPERVIRICGGRSTVLGDQHPLIFKAGADAVMTGNYLTTTGRSYQDDLDMLQDLGLTLTGKK